VPTHPASHPTHPASITPSSLTPTGVKQHAVVWLQQVGEAVEEPAVRVQLAPVGGLAGHHDLQGRVAVQPRVLLVPVALAGAGWGEQAVGEQWGRGQGFDWKRQEASGQGKVGLCRCRVAGGEAGRPGSQESRQAQQQATGADVALTWLCTRTGAWRLAGPPPPPAACSQSRSPAGGEAMGRTGEAEGGGQEVKQPVAAGELASAGPNADKQSQDPVPLCHPLPHPHQPAHWLEDWPS
jgi:hypothetical protein